ncbi:MAG: anaerobic ribonucleoside-triphosphate reductase activating protein [Muribaculaceae bacterium]|nr:anaerobic ribonucleoside-triphosphate reductase activating protein [Muribaculaceae bacterium]
MKSQSRPIAPHHTPSTPGHLRVLRVVEGTSVDGPGLRTSVYLAGCQHHCQGCHNPQSWSPTAGTPVSTDALMQQIAYNEAPLTLSGGDPLAQPQGVLELVRRVKTELGLNIWCYTGYTWEQIVKRPELMAVMKYIDVLVDSPFVLAERDTSLRFRGSRNQRLIDVPHTLLKGNHITLYSS